MKVNLTNTFSRIGFKLKQRSPEILVAAGVAGIVSSMVLACKASTKVHDILEDTKEQLSQVKQVLEDEKFSKETYSEEDAKKDTTIIYAQTGIKFIKLYGPAIILGSLSIASILTSHNILRKRNIALAAAYTVVDKSFKDYRSRVIERFGEELDHELKYNIKAKEIEEVTVDAKGKEKTKKTTISVVNNDGYSDYARFFDDGCTGWTKDAELNLVFLRQQQDHANEMLKSRGHLFLNDVYYMLGIPKTKAGQVVGWVYDEKNPVGDNFVDFGIYDSHREVNRDFVNGYERTILLDFNVDGPIVDLLATHQR